MKIIYFSYLYDIRGVSAGSANKAIGFMGALKARGHRAPIYWRSDQPEDYEGISGRLKLRHKLKMVLSRYVHDPKKLLKNAKYLVEEYRILKREKPDALFLRPELYGFSAVLLARFFHVPVVVEADAPTAFEHRYRSGRDKIRLGILPEWLERWNWKTGRHIIAISDVFKEYLTGQGIPPDRITVVPNGADPEKFRPGLRGKEIRKKLGIDRRVVIGWAGSLYGWSGLECLLEMAKRVLETRRDAVFLFVGGGKNRQIMESTFRPEDLNARVFLTGMLPYPEIPDYMDAMDVVIVPYPKIDFWYPSSMKLFEYMSSGKAVVASAVDQVKDVIRDGRNGFLFEPDNRDEFVRKVLQLVDDPVLCRKMGLAARKTVLENYSWDRHARKMERIFESVIRTSKRSAEQ